jgi:hypothetical protein
MVPVMLPFLIPVGFGNARGQFGTVSKADGTKIVRIFYNTTFWSFLFKIKLKPKIKTNMTESLMSVAVAGVQIC